MDWIKRHEALLILLLVVGMAAMLFITGRLQYNAGGKQEEEAAGTAESPNRIQGNNVVLDEESFKTSGIPVSPSSMRCEAGSDSRLPPRPLRRSSPGSTLR